MGDWKNKVVIVTGGSAGLGLAIAREFVAQQANVAIIGRDSDRLNAAVSQLQSKSDSEVEGFQADVTDEGQAIKAIEDVIERFGRLDVLVNNVGKSGRKDLLKTTLDDYRQYMEVNFLSAVSCTNAALAALQKSSGHVVNIGSLSSKTAWPYYAPYSASKFALAAYTHQLRLEGPENVHYMLVCPGPIKREDAGQRYNSEARDLPESAKEPAGGAKIRGMDPSVMARKVVRGCAKRRREIIPLRARIIFAVLAYSPKLGDWLLKRKMKE